MGGAYQSITKSVSRSLQDIAIRRAESDLGTISRVDTEAHVAARCAVAKTGVLVLRSRSVTYKGNP